MNPADTDTYELDVSVTMIRRGPNYTGGDRFTVNHNVRLGALDFMQVAGVLGQFHTLGETIRATTAAAEQVDQ